MKKLWIGMLVLGLCALAGVLVTSCAKQAGPLSPNIPLLGTGNNLNTDLLQVTDVVAPASVSGTVNVFFNRPVDPASVVAGTTALLYTLDDSGTSETLYTAYTLSWSVDMKILYVSPVGAWATNKRYRAELTTGVRSAAGTQLDGNYNGIPEGPQFDNAHATYSYGGPIPTAYNPWPNGIYVTNSYYETNAGANSFGFGYNYSVNNYYSYVTLVVQFAMWQGDASDFQMNTNTFFNQATTLNPNVVLIDANGAPVSPVNVTVTSSSGDRMDTLHVTFNPAPNTKYRFKLLGGASGIRSSDATTLHLLRGFYFTYHDTSNGFPWAQDDTDYATFQTVGATGTTVPRVYVTNTANNSTLRRIELTYNVPTGIGTLDPATITPANFMLFSDSYEIYYTPERVEVDNSLAPNPRVYVYIPMSFNADHSNSWDYLYATASKNVRAGDGTPVDQNGNGVTGEDGNQYYSPTGDNYRSPSYYGYYNYYTGSTDAGGPSVILGNK